VSYPSSNLAFSKNTGKTTRDILALDKPDPGNYFTSISLLWAIFIIQILQPETGITSH
jgi:uncharacterized membrane protein